MENNTYLKHAKLKGYKSIQDLEIDFKPGLNIIIGKNASGKSNFLQFLYKCLKLNFDGLFNFRTELEFQNDDNFLVKIQSPINLNPIIILDLINSKKEYITITKNKTIDEVILSEEELKNKKVLTIPNFIFYNIPNEFSLVDIPISFTFSKKDTLSYEIITIFNNSSSILICSILQNIFFWDFVDFNTFSVNHIKVKIEDSFSELNTLKPFLKKISPIQDIRLNENYNIFYDNIKEECAIKNLFIEFQVNGSWLPFSSLSDGTKRLFYIILEVVTPSNKSSYNTKNIDGKRTILIEEPELGIHPHQFHLLMNFLKEQSHDKQIIMTTHAPKALDILNDNELDRIILAYNTKENGTQMRHLTEKEISKGKKYMQEDFLSDYWMYSDLEK